MFTNAFLLTRQWRDTRNGVVLDLWWATESGSCWTQVTGQEVVLFVRRDQAAQIFQSLNSLRHWRMAEINLKTFHDHAVNAIYFRQHRVARDAQDIFRQ